MSKKIVRVKDTYPDYSSEGLAGVEAIILRKNGGDALIGFPLESSLGWYDSAYTTEYRCWWIAPEYLETITTITRSKFK